MKPDLETLINLKVQTMKATEEADAAKAKSREAVIHRNRTEKARIKALREWLDAIEKLGPEDNAIYDKAMLEAYVRTGKIR